MRFFSFILVFVLLASNVSGECREKECMPDTIMNDRNGGNFTFYYDSVFEIGTNWFIIFDYPSSVKNNDTISFEFNTGLGIVHMYDSNKDTLTDSISFSGSTFSDEAFHQSLFVNVTDGDGNFVPAIILKIHINKPPADDLFYLWGGMTVFWFSIGAYVLYISSKFTQLRER